jgi:hypothetical protein
MGPDEEGVRSELILTRMVSTLARIFHSCIEERSGSGVTRLVIIEPNETTHHRFFFDRL